MCDERPILFAINATTVVMEFLARARHAPDEYTVYRRAPAAAQKKAFPREITPAWHPLRVDQNKIAGRGPPDIPPRRSAVPAPVLMTTLDRPENRPRTRRPKRRWNPRRKRQPRVGGGLRQVRHRINCGDARCLCRASATKFGPAALAISGFTASRNRRWRNSITASPI